MADASSIRTVLAAVREAGVRALLMGGQACILYGAAEFSRDTDLAVVADAANLARLRAALRALDASVTAVPPFTAEVLAECAAAFPGLATEVAAERAAVAAALAGGDPDVRAVAIRTALADEEARERAADEVYWRPLLAEQAEMRAALRRGDLSLGWP